MPRSVFQLHKTKISMRIWRGEEKEDKVKEKKKERDKQKAKEKWEIEMKKEK